MFVVRPITRKDLLGLYNLAKRVTVGISNLPANPQLLQEMIDLSNESFSKDLDEPHKELYLFVLENLTAKTIEGCCAIYSRDGVTVPISFYIPEPYNMRSHLYNALDNQPLLNPIIYPEGPSEICALYLNPIYRKEGYSKLLSFSRFLFMATYPHLFTTTVFANLRGYFDENNVSPFWEKIGRKVLDVSYQEMRLLLESKQITQADLVPQKPILKKDIPQGVLEYIGKTHPNTQPVISLLQRQGFIFTREIASDDAGPIMIAALNDINIIKQTKSGIISKVQPLDFDAKPFLIANKRREFRTILDRLSYNKWGEVTISPSAAEALKVNVSDEICYCAMS